MNYQGKIFFSIAEFWFSAKIEKIELNAGHSETLIRVIVVHKKKLNVIEEYSHRDDFLSSVTLHVPNVWIQHFLAKGDTKREEWIIFSVRSFYIHNPQLPPHWETWMGVFEMDGRMWKGFNVRDEECLPWDAFDPNCIIPINPLNFLPKMREQQVVCAMKQVEERTRLSFQSIFHSLFFAQFFVIIPLTYSTQSSFHRPPSHSASFRRSLVLALSTDHLETADMCPDLACLFTWILLLPQRERSVGISNTHSLPHPPLTFFLWKREENEEGRLFQELTICTGIQNLKDIA